MKIIKLSSASSWFAFALLPYHQYPWCLISHKCQDWILPHWVLVARVPFVHIQPLSHDVYICLSLHSPLEICSGSLRAKTIKRLTRYLCSEASSSYSLKSLKFFLTICPPIMDMLYITCFHILQYFFPVLSSSSVLSSKNITSSTSFLQ